MRLPMMLPGAVLLLLLALQLPAQAGGCPPGSVRKGDRCVRCPSGFHLQGAQCVRYSCRPGCVYIGSGKCRCRRR